MVTDWTYLSQHSKPLLNLPPKSLFPCILVLSKYTILPVNFPFDIFLTIFPFFLNLENHQKVPHRKIPVVFLRKDGIIGTLSEVFHELSVSYT